MNQPSLKLWRASCRLTRIGFATLGLVHLSAFFALFLTYEALAKWIRGYSGFKCLFFAPLRLLREILALPAFVSFSPNDSGASPLLSSVAFLFLSSRILHRGARAFY
jgi:hypothetical protein